MQYFAEKYNGRLGRRAQTNVVVFHVPFTGTLTLLNIYGPGLTGGGTWYFTPRLNGVALFTGEDRLKIYISDKADQKTGLSIPVVEGDVISVDLDIYGSGSIYPYFEFNAGLDDGGAGDVIGPGSAVDGNIVLFDGATGKQIKDSGAVISTDGTFADNSDDNIPTEKAIKTYTGGLIGAADAVRFMGVIDCSTNPDYPAADAGHLYRISVGGKIGGASGVNVEAKDEILCLADGTASGNEATVGTYWNITQGNTDGIVTGPASATDDRIATFDGATGKLIQDGGAVISTDGTFGSNSDAKVPTEKAAKTYVDAQVLAGIGSIVIPVDVQIFTTPGSATWNKPAGSPLFVDVYQGGAGGGGGGGSATALGNASRGGSGGGGGAIIKRTFLASELGPTVNLSIGAGGNGGNGAASNGNAGSDGTSGGNTIFDTGENLLVCGGGGGGKGGIIGTGAMSGGSGGGITSRTTSGAQGNVGTTSSNAGGVFGGGTSSLSNTQSTLPTLAGGGGAGWGNAAGLIDNGVGGQHTTGGGAGGGAGGMKTAGDSAYNGGYGGAPSGGTNAITSLQTGSHGAAFGVGETNGTATDGGAGSGLEGGGGGGAKTSGGGKNGGDGGAMSGGGGGGGAGVGTGGNGGQGGDGFIVVISYY